MSSLSGISDELAEIEGQISYIFRALSNGFQKLEKVKDSNRQSRQLEELMKILLTLGINSQMCSNKRN